MNTISHDQIIGIDVSRDWLDVHCLPEGKRLRVANTEKGYSQLTPLAGEANALVV